MRVVVFVGRKVYWSYNRPGEYWVQRNNLDSPGHSFLTRNSIDTSSVISLSVSLDYLYIANSEKP